MSSQRKKHFERRFEFSSSEVNENLGQSFESFICQQSTDPPKLLTNLHADRSSEKTSQGGYSWIKEKIGQRDVNNPAGKNTV